MGYLSLIDAIGDATEQNAYKCAARASATCIYGSTEVRLSAQAVAARAPARGTWSCSSNHSQHILKRLHLNLVFSSTSTSTGVYGGDAHVSAVESLCPLLEGTPAPEWRVDAGVNVNEEPPASVHRERTRPRR